MVTIVLHRGEMICIQGHRKGECKSLGAIPMVFQARPSRGVRVLVDIERHRQKENKFFKRNIEYWMDRKMH